MHCVISKNRHFTLSKSGVDAQRNHRAKCVLKKVRTDCISPLYSRLASIPALSCRSRRMLWHSTIYVTRSGKTGLIRTSTDIHFLPVRESCTNALHRNTKYLIIDGQVCFYRRLFTDNIEPPGCISRP